MKPVDPRLLRRSRSARLFFIVGGVLAFVQTAAIVTFAGALTTIIARLLDGASIGAVRLAIVVLLAASVLRALSAWLWEVTGSSAAARVKSELRHEMLEARAVATGSDVGTARVATVLGPGLDALDEYFSRYLPQLLVTVVATPVLVTIAWIADPLSGLIFVLVLPVIPLFMVLIGLATRSAQERQWQSLQQLSAAFFEVVGGLGTLVLYGRAERQRTRIGTVTEEFRVRTMRVLRVTFLSGFTLELAASLSVALVAVSIGLRLVDGSMLFWPGLFVLLLAPEVFVPLRNVGAAFHASAAGVEAARDVFELLEEPTDAAPAPAHRFADDSQRDLAHVPEHAGLAFRGVSVWRGDHAALANVDLDVAPGEFVALIGPSGSGKSTVAAAVLGFVPIEGTLWWNGAPSGGRALRDQLAWAGQRTSLIEGTVASNVRLGHDRAPRVLLDRALQIAGVDLEPERAIGPEGAGLSGGQAQRVATARAVHRLLADERTLLVLDEPSSALDVQRERALAAELRALAASGISVLVTTHRDELAAAADRIVDLERVNV